MYEVAYKKSGWTTSSGEDFTLGASGSSTGFGGSVSVLVEYIDSNGGSGDSVVLEFEYSGTMNFGSSFANGSATNPSGLIITLYTDGVPEGFTRPAPGAGLEWDQDREFNNEVSGTITNNSSQDQRLEVWADQNGDGTPELIGYVTVSPGATAEVDIGVDLPPGTSVFLRASGETTGDSILTEEPGYNGLSVDMTFPPQEPYNVELVVENSTDGPAQIGIGNPDAPQDHLVFPPGTSTVQRVYQGTGSGAHAQTVTGGTTSHVSAQNGTTTQIVNVPGGGGSATVIGTATVPTGTGQQTAQIVQLPTGTQVTVGGGGGGNPVAPQTPQTGTGATGTGSSSSALTDAAAAQLAAIRAELSAAAGASQRPGEGDTEADLEAAKENIGEAVTGLQESTGQIRNVFEDLNPTLNLPTGIGKTSSVSISLLGKAYTLNFDHPAIVWFRSLILVGLSISWLIFLIKFAKT